MKIKLILTGLIIILLNFIMISVVIFKIDLPYNISMLFLTGFSLLLWFLLLRKDIELSNKVITLDIKKATTPLFSVLIGISLYLLITSENIGFDVIQYLFVTSLIVAIYEEILFRAIGLGTLLNANLAPKKAIIISSLIFSIGHILYSTIMNWSILMLLLNSFMMGVVLGYIYYRTHNIIFVIGIHFIWDFAVFINQRLASEDIGLATSLVLFVTTVVYFIWSIKDIKKIHQK